MKNFKLFITALITTLTLVSIFALALRPGMVRSQDNLSAYLPNVRLDPTLTPVPSPTPSCTYTTIDSSDETIENSVVDAIQAARDNAGEDDLNRLDTITAAARKHSQDMAENNFVDHRGSDGDYGPQRLRENCYDVAQDQEIVWGGVYSDTTTLISSWLENDNWSKAMLDDDMKDFGVGYIEIKRSDEETNEENPAPAEDYFTVSFGYTSSNRSGSITCEIELENEFGKGVLTTTNPDVCNSQNQD